MPNIPDDLQVAEYQYDVFDNAIGFDTKQDYDKFHIEQPVNVKSLLAVRNDYTIDPIDLIYNTVALDEETLTRQLYALLRFAKRYPSLPSLEFKDENSSLHEFRVIDAINNYQ